MRIGLLTTSYPRHADDLAGRFVAELASWLAGAGDTVEVLAPSLARGDHDGVIVRPIRVPRRTRLLYGAGAPDNLLEARAWLEVPPFVLRLALACRRRSAGWDALISHWLVPSGVVAARAGRGRPHLAVAHSSDVHLMARLRAAPLLAALARPRTALVLTAESLRPPLARLAWSARARRLVEDATVVRMGVVSIPPPCADERAAARARLELPPDAICVLSLGRLVPVKGVEVLLRAAAGLPAVRVVVAGDGPARQQLERCAARCGAAARFVGEQLGEAKRTCLHAADLLVAPSIVLPDGRSDSAPVTLLEAMAAHLPVVASRVGGNAELIRDGENGLLAPPGDVGALRAALHRLTSGATGAAERAHLAEAGARTAALHTWDRVGARLRGMLAAL
jgi:glycosyltransferase involved in cell wall biosynthesis